jgi:hypothetical protein
VEFEKPAAKERQKLRAKGSENFPTITDKGKVADKVGEAVGVSGWSLKNQRRRKDMINRLKRIWGYPTVEIYHRRNQARPATG